LSNDGEVVVILNPPKAGEESPYEQIPKRMTRLVSSSFWRSE